MSDVKYFNLIETIVVDSLLYLYLSVSELKGFVSRAKRNEILVRYIKPKLKDGNCKNAKVELKRLLIIGRSKGGDLEKKLNDIHAHVLKEMGNVTDAQRLFDLLEIMKYQYKIDSRFIIENEVRKPRFIYLLQAHIENCFGDDGEQVAPISLFLESPKANELEGMVNNTGLFIAEVHEINDTMQQVHLLLHPKSRVGESKKKSSPSSNMPNASQD
ncbi:hypothetical protein TUM4438_10830 [Shewanella sairae]|uniref:DUF2913 family protein n=1 Tax=Shewanella sairae TaxID=190310 RepID=A0ABQ4P631_9GAMM|nr:DUF2913 family protein [Shewanella sairae]MCL1130516.1 DUF2913 family protein [Shewanella sairae]GIU42979.1 hypothetical protein TUM4438_10830 [Shewanella sairae]